MLLFWTISLTFCRQVMCKDVITIPCVGCSVSLSMSRLLTAWTRMYGSQVTNTKTLPGPTFLQPCDSNKVTTDSGNLCTLFQLFLQQKSWLCVEVLRNMFCASYMQVHILMPDDSETIILDSDSDIPMTPQCKQLRSVP